MHRQAALCQALPRQHDLEGARQLFLAVAVNPSAGAERATALFLLGIGWNFLFIGASSLLTECYSESEKALVQAINEFLILLTVSISSLTSGILMEFFGWKALNLFVLPQIVAILCATLWLYLRTPDIPPLQTDSNPAP